MVSKAVHDQGRAGSSSSPDGASKVGRPGAGPGASNNETAGEPVRGEPVRGEPMPGTLVSRRQLLQGAGAGVALLGAGRLLGSRSASLQRISSGSAGEIVIGFVSPQTGALADFATSNNFAVSRVRQTSAYTKGFTVGGKTYSVKVIVADSQSDPNRASEVARNLVLNNHVDLIITSSTPETDNPVALVCETEGVPCISTVVPWQSWYAGLGGNPLKPTTKYQYNVMFFFGLEGFGKCFIPMWKRISTNKVVAEMFPNDADGNAFRAAWPPMMKAAGYTPVDGRPTPTARRISLP